MKTILIVFLLSCPSLWGADIEGPIKLNYTSSFPDGNDFETQFGGSVKATTQWYAGDFFGDEVVFAGIDFTNTGTKPMDCSYDVAFFDKNHKLVGAASAHAMHALKPGDEASFGSCIIHLPKGRYKDIAYYQAIIYETPVSSH